MKPDFERPPVHVSKSGVHYVLPADIFRSAVGQRGIKQMADLNARIIQREPQGREHQRERK